MFNDKATVDGVHKSLQDVYPIRSVNDSHRILCSMETTTVPNECLNYNLLAHHELQY